MNRIVNLVILTIITGSLWIIYQTYPNNYLLKGFYTFLTITLIYTFFKIIETISLKRINNYRTKYTVKKVLSIILLFVSIIAIITIWIADLQVLTISYAVLGAGIAIALQDIVKDFISGILIVVGGIYTVGDRIEFASKQEQENRKGDVIDIGLLFTTLMEIDKRIESEQATGRLTIVPNSNVLRSLVINYTKDYKYMWDEIIIPITYESNLKTALDEFLKIIKKETKEIIKEAEKELSSLRRKYYLTKRFYISNKVLEPRIFIELTSNWISLRMRFPSPSRGKSELKNKISKNILKFVEKSKKISIASEAYDINLKKQ